MGRGGGGGESRYPCHVGLEVHPPSLLFPSLHTIDKLTSTHVLLRFPWVWFWRDGIFAVRCQAHRRHACPLPWALVENGSGGQKEGGEGEGEGGGGEEIKAHFIQGGTCR